MKATEHLKSYCTFWKPSVARRITLYFLLFGVIIFLVTSALYMVAGKKKFTRSTGKMIQDQFSQLERSNQPDFLWNGVDRPRPELKRLLTVLADLSSSFYSVSDVSIYGNVRGRSWQRLYFSEGPALRSEPVQGHFVEKLERWQSGRFKRKETKILADDEHHAMFVNVTGAKDVNTYFLKIGVASEGITGAIHQQMGHFIVFFLATLVFLRFCGYYFARKIAEPIEVLSEVSTEVAKGDLSKTAPVTSNDEIGELSKNFNQMIEGLRERERIKMIEFELEKGRQIQMEFLPNKIPQIPDYEIATCFYPAGKVAGDFYDVFTLPDGRIGLVIADVCDKGVGSALYMALFRSLIRVFSNQAMSEQLSAAVKSAKGTGGIDASAVPGDIDPVSGLNAVADTNAYIAVNHGDEGMFATLFFGILNPKTGWLHYVNGGHEPLFIIGSDGIKEKLNPTGPAVGMLPESNFEIQKLRLDPGDVLIGYTDGVTEARSPEDELFSRTRLRTLVEGPANSATELLDRIKDSLFSFIDIAPRGDDVTMLAVQRVVAD